MKTLKLYGIDRPVCALALGTGGFGTVVDEKDSRAQLDAYVHAGGNFLDTAHLYGSDETHRSESEKIIGRWMKGKRDRVVLLTKGCHPDRGQSRMSEAALVEDLEGSLANLGTDYVDVYLLHRDDPAVPVEEILAMLEGQYRRGRLRNYGCSNWSPARIVQAADCAREKGYRGFTFNQFMWSLADINSADMTDSSMVPVSSRMMALHQKEEINAMAYTSVARAYFSRKDSCTLTPGDERLYQNRANEAIYRRLRELCREGYTMMDFALAFFTAQPFPALPVAAFANMAQFEEGMAFLNKTFDTSVLQGLSQLKLYP